MCLVEKINPPLGGDLGARRGVWARGEHPEERQHPHGQELSPRGHVLQNYFSSAARRGVLAGRAVPEGAMLSASVSDRVS